jgi:hypothetical protein
MTTIFWKSLSGGCCVSIDETTDTDYARDCFDGSDREWQEVLTEANESNPATFYIVSSGLSGCYMRDNVSVFGCKADALRMAQDEVQRDKDESEDEETDTDEDGVQS